MFLEVGCKSGGGMGGASSGVLNHKRAARDFVAELTGSPRARGEKKGMQDLVHADELPVPMFGVDVNLRCTFWNRFAHDLANLYSPLQGFFVMAVSF